MRIGFDMDGVLADFASAFCAVETAVCFPTRRSCSPDPARRGGGGAGPAPSKSSAAGDPHEMRQRHEKIWEQICATPNFWPSLPPTEPGAVRRVHELMMRYRWEVFFITQRPETDGDTVQRQTQRWLVEQGFDLPSVLVIARVARSGRRRASTGLPRRRQRPELPRRDGGRCRESRAHLGPIGSGRRRVQEAGRRDYADDRRVPGSSGEGLRRAEQPDAAEQACGARRVEVAKYKEKGGPCSSPPFTHRAGPSRVTGPARLLQT